MNELHRLWLDLGQPSYISGFNFALIIAYLSGKIFDVLNKNKREKEIFDRIELLSYRISKLENSLSSTPNL